jgi:hypothetical protein
LVNHRSAEGKVSRDCDVNWRKKNYWSNENTIPHFDENIITNDSLREPNVSLDKTFNGTPGSFMTITGKIYGWNRWTAEVNANVNGEMFQ